MTNLRPCVIQRGASGEGSVFPARAGGAQKNRAAVFTGNGGPVCSVPAYFRSRQRFLHRAQSPAQPEQPPPRWRIRYPTARAAHSSTRARIRALGRSRGIGGTSPQTSPRARPRAWKRKAHSQATQHWSTTTTGAQRRPISRRTAAMAATQGV